MTHSTNPFELFASGRHRDALALLRTTLAARDLDVSEKVLHAELTCASGEYLPAMTLAMALLERNDLTDIQRCRVQDTLGQCSFSRGNSALGTAHYRNGADFAARVGLIEEECRLRLQLFRHEIRWSGLARVGTDLELLRRKVHQAGSASIAVYFQLILTELAARQSLLARARQHLETARALMPNVENLFVHRQFRHTEVVLTSEEGDSTEALRLGLALARDERVGALTPNLLVTIAHVLLMQSKFGEAEDWLHRALATTEKSGGHEIGVLETMMSLRLLQNDLADAGRWDQSVRSILEANVGLRDSSYALWHVLTRARWLYDQGQFKEGLSELLEARPRIAQLTDRRMGARAKLLIAEGLGRTGRAAEGLVLAVEASEPRSQPLEVYAEASRVVGGLLASEGSANAVAYYARAEQVFGALGQKALADRVAVERSRSTTIERSQSRLDHSPGSDWCERMAAVLSVGGHPLILAEQTEALIADTGAAASVTLIRAQATRQADDFVHIAVGVHRDGPLELRIEPRETVASRATLLAIARVARSSLELAQARTTEREQVALLPTQAQEQPAGLICTSERMLDLLKTIRHVAASSVTVLLTGETGVGKELLARALHLASPRTERMFLPFNCSTVPREMFDSQLFGHKRGSFTGAISDSAGVIRAAAGGTLFLDEIGEMSVEAQPKLLRFLESGEILPLGETRPQHVDVRVVAATNANLDQLVAEGKFREDLYYRLNVIRLNIPPLRERREEIPALVQHFLERFGQELQKPLLRVADETLEYLVLYRWPGNVRQLANEIRRLVAMAEPGGVIMPAHLSNDIAESRRTLPANRSPRLFDEVVTRIDQPLSAVLEHVERAAIQRALAMTDGHLDEAARMLGLSRKGLYLKRQRLNLG